MIRRRSQFLAVSTLVLVLGSSVGCGSGSDGGEGSGSGSESAATTSDRLADGPVTLVALGDSLTAGEGDDSGQGYVGRLTTAIAAVSGRGDTTSLNLGQSGWDSSMMVDGQDGTDSQLAPALEEVRSAVDDGRAVLATVLIGSNDLWYVYEYGPEGGTPAENEDAALDLYRANLDRAVTELQEAGAVVVIGLPDDQSLRPGVADIGRLNEMLSMVTEEEVEQMARLAERFDEVAEEIAADHGILAVDTNDPFWADQSTMADDGIHPNGDGYAVLAEIWMKGIEPLL